MYSVVAFVAIAAAALIVIRIGALALAHTGLSHDTAGFQALSAFFGVGFTTREAELVVNHPVRRRIIRDLILLGHLGIFGAMGTLLVAFVPEDANYGWQTKLGVLLGGLVVIWAMSKFRSVRAMLDWMITFTLRNAGVVRPVDYDLLLKVASGFCVSEVELDPHHWLIGCSLRQTRLADHHMIVLGISRDNGSYIGGPGADTEFMVGDVLLMYARETDVRRLAAGDRRFTPQGKGRTPHHPGHRHTGEHEEADDADQG